LTAVCRPPVGERHLGDGAAQADAGVVDQDVETPEAVLGFGDGGDPGVFVGDVVAKVGSPTARWPAQAVDDLPAQVVLDVRHENGGAFGGQTFGATATDSAGPAGDQRHLALDPSRHGVLPCFPDG
jgi:hypothetical protein